MQKTGMLGVILEKVMAGARKVGSIVLVTIGSCLVTALVTGSSYLAVILPGELLGPAFKRMRLAPKNLSRIIDECGGIIVPLIPWSMAGVYVSGALGVPVLDYLPWAIGNYAAIVILAAFGLTGFTMTKTD
jgi:NhaC family Na+:H+ antiporter